MPSWRGATAAAVGLCSFVVAAQMRAQPQAAPLDELARQAGAPPDAGWATWTGPRPGGEAVVYLGAAEDALIGGEGADGVRLRLPLAGDGGPVLGPAAAIATAPSAAELLAERRGLDLDDPRVAIDLRPAAVTFWIGSAAEDGILRDIAVSPWNADWGADTFYGVSYSHRLGRFWRDFTVDIEAGGGFRAGRTDTPEAWGALYVRYDGFPWRNRLYTSFGLSTGLNWLNGLPVSETGPPERREPHTTKVLHYFSPEIVFALPAYPEHEIAIRYAHRCGMFGLFNGVWEGSNVLMLGYRRRL